MSHDITRDPEYRRWWELWRGQTLELQDIPASKHRQYSVFNFKFLKPKYCKLLRLIQSSRTYLSENTLDLELLTEKRWASIEIFSGAVFTHKRRTDVYLSGASGERAEKLLFKGDSSVDFIKYTN